MTLQKQALYQILNRYGITLWIRGKPFGKIKDDGERIGLPKCHNCNRVLVLGITLDGRQNVCRDCLDALRNLLYHMLKEQYPELLPDDVEVSKD